MRNIEEIKQNKRLLIQEIGEDGGWALRILRAVKPRQQLYLVGVMNGITFQ